MSKKHNSDAGAATLDESRQRYVDLYDLAPVGYLTVDAGGAIVMSNLHASTLLGVPRAELAGRPLSGFVAPDSQDAYYLHRKVALEAGGREPCDLGLKRADGRPCWVRLESTVVETRGAGEVSLVTLSDITRRVADEEALRESARRYRGLFDQAVDLTGQKAVDNKVIEVSHAFDTIFDSAPILISAKDLGGTVILVNARFDVLEGPPAAEFVGKNVRELFPPEIADALWENDQKAIATGAPVEADEVVKHRDGSMHTYLTRKFPLCDSEGRIYASCAISTDITERKRAEDALRESEARYRNVVESQTEVICRFAGDGTITFVNEVFCRFFGRRPDDFIGKRWHPVAVAEDVPRIEAQLRALSPANPVEVIENRVFDGAGRVRWMQFTNHAKFDDEGDLFETLAVGRDITDRKEAEDALVAEREKLRALAARQDEAVERERRRIAEELHDHVGQTLGLAKIQLDAVTPAYGDRKAAAARREAKRSIDRALDFSRTLSAELHPPVLKQMGIGPALRWLAVQSAERDGIDVTARIAARIPRLDEATASFVFRAAHELLRNAVKHGRASRVAIALKAGPKRAVTLVVKDDGQGFKPPAAGSPATLKGFGLFSLRERLDETGGALAIASAPGKGATITATVPLPRKVKA